MACQIQTDKYTDVVLDLIRLDPNVYNNFDNAASLILRSGLTSEQKMLSVHNLAHIYAGLADLDSEYYQKGKAADVIGTAAVMEDPQTYVQTLSKLYGIKKPSPISVESILKKIDLLGGKSTINRVDISGPDGVIELIRNFFITNQFENLEERTQLLEQLTSALRAQIVDRQMSQDNKDFLLSQVENMEKGLNKRSDYIPIAELAGLASLNNVLVTLKSGQMVEAVSENGQLLIINSDGSLQEISQDQVETIREARITDRYPGNAGEHVFYEDTLLSSFRVQAVDSTQSDVVYRILNTSPQPLASMRIYAVKISSVGDDRVQRIQALAASDPAMSKLAGRQHETFENVAQTKYLLSDSNAKILTLARPKASEQSFVLMGEIIGTGQKFYIYANENMAFVSSDNTTERVDFTNPAHLAEVQRLSVKEVLGKRSSLSADDLEALEDGVATYQAFKASIQEEVLSAFAAGDTSVDITEQFASAYEMTTGRSNKVITPLGTKLQSDSTLYKSLTVINTKTNVKDVRKIPFLFNNVSGPAKVFRLVDILGSDERILVELEGSSEPVQMTLQYYAEKMLGLDYKRVKSLLTSTDDKQMNVIIRFNPNGSLSYNIAENIALLSSMEEFAGFITGLANVLVTSTDRDKDVHNFDVNQYSFNSPISNRTGGETNDRPLYLAFSTNRRNQLQIRIKPASKNPEGRYGFIWENKDAFHFLFSENIIIQTAKALTGGPLVKKIQEKYHALARFDLTKPDELHEFYRTINIMSREGSVDSLIMELADNVRKANERFTQQIRDEVINKLETQTSEFPQFMKNLREDFTYKGVFRPDYLFLRYNKDGTTTANIKFSFSYKPINGIDARTRFGSYLNNYMHIDSGAKRMKIIPKHSTGNLTSIPAPPIVVPTVERPVQIHAPSPVQKPAPSGLDIPKLPMLSLIAGAIETETDTERLTAVAWLINNLPQFRISEFELAKIIELSKLDGTVLGAFKDRVIYLNSQIKGKGVVYHEAFHGVFRYLLEDSYREGLIDLVKGDKKHTSKFTEEALKEFARRRNYVYDKTTMERLQAEEILADGFQKYMLNKQKPKGVLGELMEFLKRLLEMFTQKSNEIDELYGNIRRGRYSQAVVTSEIFEGQVAYEMIEGLMEIIPNPDGVGVVERPMTLSSSEKQNDLVNMVTYYLLKGYNDKETFEQNFDRVAKIILKKEYNLDRLIASHPEKREQILARLGDTWKHYRFMLGARMLGEELFDLNNSGNPDYDGLLRPNEVQRNTPNGTIAVDNIDGKASKEVLMKLVKAQFEKIRALVDGVDMEDEKLTPELADQLINEEDGPVYSEDDETGSNDQETESADFDKGLNQYNRLEGVNKEIRRFLALVKYERLDPELGIELSRLVNGDQLFGVLLSVTSDIDVDNIIPHIKTVADSARYDGNLELADDLENIYKKIGEWIAMDADGKPQENLHFYNMFLDALDGTELDFLVTNINTVKKEDPGGTTTETTSYTIKDQVLFQDTNRRKNDIIRNMTMRHAASFEDKKYQEAAQELIVKAKEIHSSNFILEHPTSQATQLTELTEKLHTLMTAVGMNIPKSMVRLSLMAIDRVENNVVHNNAQFEQTVLDHYDHHEQMIAEQNYLQKDFFLSLAQIFEEALEKNHNDFASFLNKDKNAELEVDRFNVILRRAAAYMVKYDPMGIQSTIKDSENKSRYRFVSYTPALRFAQTLRRKGLTETLKEDPYFNNYLESWFEDNPMLGQFFTGTGSDKDKVKTELFLRNFRVAMYGGVSQTINGKFKPGKSFKNVDSKSMYIQYILSFLNRTSHKQIVKDKEGKASLVEIQTYLRSFSQLEASQTNFLITAMYDSYANKDGMVKTADGYLKITDTLTDVVRQEYNRIQREWNKRAERKRAFDSGTGNELILQFNAIHDKDDVTKADVDSLDLRAYQFNKIPEFFQANGDLLSNEAETGLRDYALKGTSFESLPEDVIATLRRQLDQYAQGALNAHLDRLVELGVVKKEVKDLRIATGALYRQKGTDGKVTRYTSSLIAPKLKIDNQEVKGDIFNIYQKTPVNYDASIEGIAPRKIESQGNLEGLLADAFFNFWANALSVNDLLDGDSAMNVKNSTDYFKRQKKQLAAGSTLKRGTHTVAYINTIKAFIHESFPQHGPYYDAEEIKQDSTLTEDVRTILLRDFTKAVNKVKETVIVDGKEKTIEYADMMRDIFDGQSFSTLMHQMDMHEAMGRLTPKIAELMIAKHYRKLTQEEIELMKNGKVVNNSKKTVTAARNSYHKQSESYIDRNDVSVLDIPKAVRGDGKVKEYIKETHDKIHGLYHEVYSLRKQIQEAKASGLDTVALLNQLKKNMTEIHSYYKPMPHREQLHDLLNAMEYYQVDQLMDTTASKNATLLPVDYIAEKQKLGKTSAYINLALSSLEVDNRYKFLQVETSGVKDTAKFSVQAKALIAADLINIAHIARLSGREISESEAKSIEKIATILRTYQSTLKDVGESNLINLKTILRKDGDFEIGKIYKLIKASLESQGAPMNTLKLFDLKSDGTPVYSSNMPGIRNILEYYFFSQYSKNITDEKRSGFKNILMSSFGYDVLVDPDGNIITTEAYRRTPYKYPVVKRRPLGVSVETNADGTKTYFVEAIVPKPFFRNKAHEEFYMKNLTKMFATRIPTEDKRSMIVIKVVDYIDSSNLTGIIVPHFVHLLAGSDFDVDPLYGQKFAHYFNADNVPVLYGDYSGYSSEAAGRYTEFVEYMSKDEDVRVLVDMERKRIEALKDEYKASDDARLLVGYTAKRLSDETDVLKEYDAILEAFKKLGLPVSLKQFEDNPKLSKVVRPAFQNANLRAMMDILSSEAVFNNLYINERSSVQAFEDIAKTYGRSIKGLSQNVNHLSIDGVVVTKQMGSVYKSGIEIAANLNKFVALASQFGLELKSEHVIWAFNDAIDNGDGTVTIRDFKKYTNFGGLSEDNKRVIAAIGNILGMFADGMKKPIPYALGMNDVNAGVTIAMIGLGLSPEFAIGFNFMPEVVRAVQEVQATTYAVSDSETNTTKFLSSEVDAQIEKLVKENIPEFQELKDLGLITGESTSRRIVVNRTKIAMKFAPKKLDDTKVFKNTVTSKEIGYELSALLEAGYKDPKTGELLEEDMLIPLSEVQQRIILLKLYSEQAQQQFAIQRTGSILNTFKKLNPRFVSFDKLLKNMNDVFKDTKRNIFTAESTKKIFKDDQVFKYLYDAMNDLDEQSSKLFLERSGFFSEIKSMFEEVFEDKSRIAKIITSYVALRKYQRSMPGSRFIGVQAIDEMIAQDDKNLLDSIKAEYFFTNNLKKEVDEMLQKYPDNKFLQLLVSDEGEVNVLTEKNQIVPERGLKLIGKANLSGSYASNVMDDAFVLMMRENLFVKKLFYHELAKTGMQYKKGSFLQLLPTEMMKPLSANIDDFVKKLESTRGNPYQLIPAIKEFLGAEATDQDVYDFFDEVFLIMANDASNEVGNNRIKYAKKISFNKDGNLMKSFKFDEKLSDTERRDIARNVLLHFMNQAPARDSLSFTPVNTNGSKKITEIVVDMSKPVSIPQATNDTMRILGETFGIRPDFKTKNYIFPLMFKIKDVTYLLQGVNDQVGYSNFGESMVRAIVGSGISGVLGTTARYVAIPASINSGMLSPIAYPKQEIEKYLNYVKRTSKLPVVAAPAPEAQPAVSAQQQSGSARSNDPAQFTNHSGGAKGADSIWDQEGRKVGVVNHNHYYYGNKTPKGNVILTKEQVEEGIVEMRKAAAVLGKNPQREETINLLARNWFQVKNSEQIVAVAPIAENMKMVEGGTGWAVAMGQTNGKEIHVFNQKDNKWYTWNGVMFTVSTTPKLKKNFAGIGTRDITEQGKQAIRDVYQNTFAQPAAESKMTFKNVEKVVNGVYVVRNALSKEEQLELFELLKPFIEKQATKSNKGTFANKMIGLGLRWDYRSNNPSRSPINIPNIIEPASKAKYGYYNVAADGSPLGGISSRLKELMTKATGVDATNYDGAIINLYDDKTFISSHNDVDESADAIMYPVIVANIGGSGNFAVERVGKQPISLNAGDAYIFGENGLNRTVYHRTFPSKQDGFLPAITTQSDNRTYESGSYRISITMRRVMPLERGMPEIPAQTFQQSQPAAPNKLKGQMKFDYGANKRSDVTAISTFDAILKGERTATTRYESQGKLEYWKQAKVGDIITWESADGRTVDVIVTKALHPLKGSGKTPEVWSKLEGWSKEYFNKNVMPKLDEAWQIEYRLAQPAATLPATQPSTQPTGVKEGVSELFDSNPELANQVYEALGVKSANISLDIESFGKSIDNIDIIKDGKKIGYVQISKNNTAKTLTVTGIELKEKGFGKNVYLELQRNYPDFNIKSDKTALSPDAINMWDSLVSKKLAIKKGEKEYTLDTKQAIQLYSQYLDTGKQDIEGFKKFVVNPSTQAAPAIQTTTPTTEDFIEATPDATAMLLQMMGESQEEAQPQSAVAMQPGQFVKYNNETFIFTKVNTNGTIQIYNPLLEGVNAKKSVSANNLQLLNSKAELVTHKNEEYLVTPKGTIISLTKNKAMRWGENNGERREILAKAQSQRSTNIDLQNLNMTADVINTLYEQSNKRLSKDSFAQAAITLVANLRSTTPTDQILEKIKCL